MDMEIEIISQRENVLLDRLEVEFRLAHPKERTPKRSVVRGQIAEALGVPKGQVIVDHMKTEFGISRTRGYAKAYRHPETMMRIEQRHILRRNGIVPGQGTAPAGASGTGKDRDHTGTDDGGKVKGGAETAGPEGTDDVENSEVPEEAEGS